MAITCITFVTQGQRGEEKESGFKEEEGGGGGGLKKAFLERREQF